jgi:hypothetical protein
MTLAQKVWDQHVVHSAAGDADLLYIDLHLVHEVTSPQAFDGLRLTGRPLRRPDLTVATEDHNVPTADIHLPIADPISAKQVQVLRDNAAEYGFTLFPMGDPNQGIVHVIGPEQGRTLPGMTIVCGDSHTATMAHSVHLHSESELVKWNMFLQHRLFRNHVRSGCPSLLKAMRQKASPLKTSSLPSSAKSEQAAALATSSNIAVPLYVPFLWKAA